MSKPSAIIKQLEAGSTLYPYTWGKMPKPGETKANTFYNLALKCLKITDGKTGDKLMKKLKSDDYKGLIENIKMALNINSAGPVLLETSGKLSYPFTLAELIVGKDAHDLTQQEHKGKQQVSFKIDKIDDDKNKKLAELLCKIDDDMRQACAMCNKVKYLEYEEGDKDQKGDGKLTTGFNLKFGSLFWDDSGNDTFSVAIKMKKEQDSKGTWVPQDQPSIKISNMNSAYRLNGKTNFRPFKTDETVIHNLYKLFGAGTIVRGILRPEWTLSKNKVTCCLGFGKGSIDIKSLAPSEDADGALTEAFGDEGIVFADEESTTVEVIDTEKSNSLNDELESMLEESN